MMLRKSLRTSLVLATLAILPLSSSAASLQVDEGRESLEQLLERLRQKQGQRLSQLRGQVDPLLDELRTNIADKSAKKIAKTRGALIALGPEIAPILVEYLAPLPEAKRTDIELSRQVATVLATIPSAAITDALLRLCDSPDDLTKRNALRVLATNPEVERVSPRVIELFEKGEGQVQAMALSAIAQLGGESGDKILKDVLLGKNEELRGIALDAVVSAGATQFAPEMLSLLRNIDVSGPVAFKFVAYYSRCPDIVDKEHVGALVEAATDGRVQAGQRVGILRHLTRWDRYIDSKLKRKLRSLESSGNKEVARQALILLAVLGDKGARRDLLEPYDDEVKDAGLWTGPFVNRGTVLYEIREYTQALRDFKQAIKLSKDEPRSVPSAFEYAARCSAQLGKLKQAADYLERAPISLDQLRALALEPVFAELRESRYGRVFRLED